MDLNSQMIKLRGIVEHLMVENNGLREKLKILKPDFEISSTLNKEKL